MTLVADNICIACVFAPLGILTVLDGVEPKRYEIAQGIRDQDRVAVGIVENERGVGEQIRCSVSVELDRRSVGTIVQGGAEHISVVFCG